MAPTKQTAEMPGIFQVTGQSIFYMEVLFFMHYFVLLMELAGTVAFAVSGAMLGLTKRMDVFGVCIMGLVTACGGGMLRDLFLGILPPAMFREPVYAVTAFCTSLLLFFVAAKGVIKEREGLFEWLTLIADSVGLGIFTASGAAITIQSGYGSNFFFCVFLGTITGVGGGVIRDILAGTSPYIFVKHIYACASIIGGVLCVFCWSRLGQNRAMIVCVLAVFAIRILAARYRLSLPKAQLFPAGKT